jgi:hypothetical protein
MWDLCQFKNKKFFVRRRSLHTTYHSDDHYNVNMELYPISQWANMYEQARSLKREKDYYLIADLNDVLKENLKCQLLVDNL